jgi:hypothetical protein
MPDKDLFQRTFARGWNKVYRLAKDGAGDDSEVGAACVAAVAKSLRETKGCPGFNDFSQSYLRMYRAYVEEWGVFPLNVN